MPLVCHEYTASPSVSGVAREGGAEEVDRPGPQSGRGGKVGVITAKLGVVVVVVIA